MKLSRADQERMLAALERMRREAKANELKREEKLWSRGLPDSFSLRDLLSGLTKSEMDSIRQSLEIPGISALKKQDMAAALEVTIPQYFEHRLALLDAGQVNLLLDIARQGGVTRPITLSKEQLDFFMRLGCLTPGHAGGERALAMPLEVVTLLKLDKQEWMQRAERNSEWIHLTQGLLYYYGVLSFGQVYNRVNDLAKQGSMTMLEYSILLRSNAIPYYGGIRHCKEGYQYYRVFDSKKVVQEHKVRPDVDFYPFLYQQLIKAGQKDYVERNFAYRKFTAYIMENYDITAAKADSLVEECVYAIQIQHSPIDILEFLQSNLEIDAPTLKQMLQHITSLGSTTRQWVLKGYTPDELFERDNTYLEPLPGVPYPFEQASPVRKEKVGRNDPCPCGSGKKYKKCCGK